LEQTKKRVRLSMNTIFRFGLQRTFLVIRVGIAVALTGLAMGCSVRPDDTYVGRYSLSEDVVLVVRNDGGNLTLLPSYWRTPQILDPIATDTFVSKLHREIRFRFARNASGRIDKLVVTGHKEIGGEATRLAKGVARPVELLLADDPAGAVRLLEEQGGLRSPDRAVSLGFEMIRNYPSRAATGAEFLRLAAERTQPNADLNVALGLGWMLRGRREDATAAFREAARLAPDDPLVVRALRHLDPASSSPLPDSVWRVPFDLDTLFSAPTAEETERVRAGWSKRDLIPRGVVEEARHEFVTAAAYTDGEPARFDVRIVSHQVHGDKHYGAILVPAGGSPACCGVIVEAHGIDANYGGFDLANLQTPNILSDDGARAVIVVPSFRGEELRINEASYRSQGDPRDGWDGAADDAIALLNVALASTPEIDSERVCVFGKSRGGTVALLVGERDQRVDCVVDWAGPAEWFGHMGTFGWTLREQVEWAMWENWPPGRGWGSGSQFIDWFLADAIVGDGPDLATIRERILASSPLYFLDSLPAAEMHYGADDRFVPSGNANILEKRLSADGTDTPFAVYLYPGSGHDMPYPDAYVRAHAFLARYLW
jgi:dienelactone hydrolase